MSTSPPLPREKRSQNEAPRGAPSGGALPPGGRSSAEGRPAPPPAAAAYLTATRTELSSWPADMLPGGGQRRKRGRDSSHLPQRRAPAILGAGTAKVEPRSSGRDRRSSAPAPLRPRQSLGGERRRTVARSCGPPAGGTSPGRRPQPRARSSRNASRPRPGPAVGTARARGPTGARGARPPLPPSRPPAPREPRARRPRGCRRPSPTLPEPDAAAAAFTERPAFGCEPGGRAAFIPDANSRETSPAILPPNDPHSSGGFSIRLGNGNEMPTSSPCERPGVAARAAQPGGVLSCCRAAAARPGVQRRWAISDYLHRIYKSS